MYRNKMMSHQIFGFRQQFTISIVLLVLCLLFSIIGCTRNTLSLAAQDEQRLREYWKIPDRVSLISLTSKPQASGTFGREGLRIYVVFKLSPEQLQQYRKTFRETDWLPLPIAANIFNFKDAPVELPHTIANGVYICDISLKQQGQQSAPQTATGKETSDDISQFHIAFLNLDDATLHVIYKAYY
jgi:hypothetical protein